MARGFSSEEVSDIFDYQINILNDSEGLKIRYPRSFMTGMVDIARSDSVSLESCILL